MAMELPLHLHWPLDKDWLDGHTVAMHMIGLVWSITKFEAQTHLVDDPEPLKTVFSGHSQRESVPIIKLLTHWQTEFASAKVFDGQLVKQVS